ncbi:SusC/RagA family TonB-linked outer membrane protein [Pedobacter yulinensis]|uniref:SusC/RagA family TonB-linked outer membrane protein n=2 Tax=Pedobacter yulinensis TaxID=2126353 RepID=A0A2T3HJ20_9SPHI|nr:SusC/RagA family TonB-linked outer membrane protein [Pedobacter yulinensis]
MLRQDTTKKQQKDSLPADTGQKPKKVTLYGKLTAAFRKDPDELSKFPAISLQQTLKGNYAGLYVQEPSGEPGSIQNMFLRGTPLPLLNKRNVYEAQPLVILDGIPMVGEHPFAFDVQQYDFNRIGTATNLLTNIDINNIESIEVLKDAAATAIYGPRAVNGAILLTTKAPGPRRAITFNTFFGMAQRPGVTTINGKYENEFRQRFYDIYTTNGRYSDDEVYPVYLSDSLNTVYSGKSDWTDLYYRNALVYGLNLGLMGGTDRANFRLSLGNTKSSGVADDTGLDRYSVMFGINMRPVKWLLFSAMVNANRLNRDRNRSLRDRFAQINYFPDMTAPLSPNKDFYGSYIDAYKKGFDDNKTNTVQGYARLVASLGRLSLSSTFNLDYNESYRDIFYARTLLQGNSYASNYYGLNQRLMLDNKASYDLDLAGSHHFNFSAGQSVMWDLFKYSNAYAYKGVNDYIKINLLETDVNDPNYLNPLAFPKQLTYRFLDKTQDNLVSFYGKADYTFKEKYFASVLVRADGSSNAQPTHRWFYAPTLSVGWSIKNEFLKDNTLINDAIFRVSAGRIGRTNSYDNYSQGPQYTAFVGYTGNLTVPGYNAFGALTRSYSFGWVGYDIPWAYSDQLNVGADLTLLDNRLSLAADFYTKIEKNLLLGVPAYAEYGYTQAIKSGMSVKNTGIDLTLSAKVLSAAKFTWNSSLNLNHNKNVLRALPGGLDQLVIGNRLLRVGAATDQYWLLQNDGIFTADAEVPLVNGQPQKYNGIALKAGDPRWRDQNGDNQINDDDKVLLGNAMPTLVGGFENSFRYGNWSLSALLYFNLGRKIINEESAARFDFINREGNSDVASVKEITFWEKRGDYSRYPLYNPWSTVIPYRIDQDLFLENGDFLKLRSLTLGYELKSLFSRKDLMKRLFVYGSANNLFTITGYSGQDPELVGYNGYDTGYGMPIPRTYTLGVKLEL